MDDSPNNSYSSRSHLVYTCIIRLYAYLFLDKTLFNSWDIGLNFFVLLRRKCWHFEIEKQLATFEAPSQYQQEGRFKEQPMTWNAIALVENIKCWRHSAVISMTAINFFHCRHNKSDPKFEQNWWKLHELWYKMQRQHLIILLSILPKDKIVLFHFVLFSIFYDFCFRLLFKLSL